MTGSSCIGCDAVESRGMDQSEWLIVRSETLIAMFDAVRDFEKEIPER